MSKSYFIETAGGSYNIEIGSGIINEFDNYLEKLNLHKKRLGFVTNKTIWNLYSDLWEKRVLNSVLIEDGEKYKNLETYNYIIDRFLELGLNRDSVVIAFGGGVVGDITGFVAGTLYRGVKFIQVPTTLLSFVDSSVGGKTGVNHKLGKNLIGVFNQPEIVIIDIDFLKTLSLLDIINGSGEIIKHYFISGNSVIKNIIEQDNIISLVENFQKDKLIDLIYENVKIKGDVVSQDEKESGLRRVLNYGHTFGHVFEAMYQYRDLTHGYGVMLGMLVAAEVSLELGLANRDLVDYHYKLLAPYLDKIILSKKLITKEQFKEYIFHDKKVKDSKINLVLLEDVGKFKIIENSDINMLYNKFMLVYNRIIEV